MPIPLKTQQQFEELWFHRDLAVPALEGQNPDTRTWIVYFGASWCGPCKRLDIEAIQKAATDKGIPLWKCDVDENDYTPGFCQVRSIPTFICFTPGTIVGSPQNSDTDSILQWIYNL